jgi:hypothetical protein
MTKTHFGPNPLRGYTHQPEELNSGEQGKINAFNKEMNVTYITDRETPLGTRGRLGRAALTGAVAVGTLGIAFKSQRVFDSTINAARNGWGVRKQLTPTGKDTSDVKLYDPSGNYKYNPKYRGSIKKYIRSHPNLEFKKVHGHLYLIEKDWEGNTSILFLPEGKLDKVISVSFFGENGAPLPQGQLQDMILSYSAAYSDNQEQLKIQFQKMAKDNPDVSEADEEGYVEALLQRVSIGYFNINHKEKHFTFYTSKVDLNYVANDQKGTLVPFSKLGRKTQEELDKIAKGEKIDIETVKNPFANFSAPNPVSTPPPSDNPPSPPYDPRGKGKGPDLGGSEPNRRGAPATRMSSTGTQTPIIDENTNAHTYRNYYSYQLGNRGQVKIESPPTPLHAERKLPSENKELNTAVNSAHESVQKLLAAMTNAHTNSTNDDQHVNPRHVMKESQPTPSSAERRAPLENGKLKESVASANKSIERLRKAPKKAHTNSTNDDHRREGTYSDQRVRRPDDETKSPFSRMGDYLGEQFGSVEQSSFGRFLAAFRPT